MTTVNQLSKAIMDLAEQNKGLTWNTLTEMIHNVLQTPYERRNEEVEITTGNKIVNAGPQVDEYLKKIQSLTNSQAEQETLFNTDLSLTPDARSPMYRISLMSLEIENKVDLLWHIANFYVNGTDLPHETMDVTVDQAADYLDGLLSIECKRRRIPYQYPNDLELCVIQPIALGAVTFRATSKLWNWSRNYTETRQ